MTNIQTYIDSENDRQGRIERVSATMPSSQAQRLAEIKQYAEVALARVYGGRIAPELVQRMTDGLILDASVLCSIGGGVDEMPKSADGWDAFAKGLVASEPLAQRCVEFSDAKLKEALRQDELSNLSPQQRMSMARDNSLDAYVDEKVQQRLEDRLDR